MRDYERGMRGQMGPRFARYGLGMGRLVQILVCCALAVLAGCGMPRDPDDTLKRVTETKRLRAGAVVNPPWVVQGANGAISGVEAELVSKFARDLDAQVEWVVGPETELLEGVAKGQLDLVVGGLDAKSPWKKEVGLTKPYVTTHVRVGAAGSEPPEKIEDHPVNHDRLQPSHGVHIEKKKGKPRPQTTLHATTTSDSKVLVAAEEWRLAAWGLHASPKSLHKMGVAIAVPQGENAWLLRLEKFLHGREDLVIERLIELEQAEIAKGGAKP